MSTRDISSAYITALAAQPIRAVVFFRLDFDTTPLLAHTEIGPRTAVHPVHGSESYDGVGDIGGLSASIVESVGNAPQAVRFTLSGVNAARVTTALDDTEYHRRDVDIMLGLDDANGDLIGDPVEIYSGYMDKADLTLDKNVASITMTCESRATILQDAPLLRFTDEALQEEYTGDLGGEYIFRMLDMQLPWGDGKVQHMQGFRNSAGLKVGIGG